MEKRQDPRKRNGEKGVSEIRAGQIFHPLDTFDFPNDFGDRFRNERLPITFAAVKHLFPDGGPREFVPIVKRRPANGDPGLREKLDDERIVGIDNVEFGRHGRNVRHPKRIVFDIFERDDLVRCPKTFERFADHFDALSRRKGICGQMAFLSTSDTYNDFVGLFRDDLKISNMAVVKGLKTPDIKCTDHDKTPFR